MTKRRASILTRLFMIIAGFCSVAAVGAGILLFNSLLLLPSVLLPLVIASFYHYRISLKLTEIYIVAAVVLFIFVPVDRKAVEIVLVSVLSTLGIAIIHTFISRRRNGIDRRDEYEFLFRNVFLGVFVVEAVDEGENFIICDMNPAAEKIHGIRRRNALGKEIDEVLPWVKESTLFGTFQEICEGEEKPDISPILVQSGKRSYWIKNYVYKQTKNVLINVFSDVTDWIETRGELEEQKQLYEALFENKHIIMLLIDPLDGSIVNANRLAVEFYGYSREKLLSMKVADINTLPENKLQVELQKARLQNTSFFHFKHRLANGEVREVEVHSGPVVQKGRVLLFSVIHDVTSRNRTEKELAESRARYVQLAENIPDIVFVLDGNLNCVYWNKACEQLTKIPAEAAMGKPVEKIYPFANKNRIRSMLNDMIRYPRTNTYIENITVDKESLSFEISALPTGVGVLFVVRDMTDKIKLTSELLEVNRFLEAIGKCNEAIVYAANEKDLLDEVCRSLIEFGMYQSIWIAFYDPDSPERPLNVISEAGKKKPGHPANRSVRISIGNPMCSVRQVMQKKFPIRFVIDDDFYIKNLQSDLDIQPGVKAGFCIPMLYQSDLLGILMIYSVKEESFKEEEARYLTDLTANIAHAVMGYRSRDQKLIAERKLHERLRYEEGLAMFSRSLLSDDETAIREALGSLLSTSGTERVYIFGNSIDDTGELGARILYEMRSNRAAPAIEKSPFGKFRYSIAGDLQNRLENGGTITNLLSDFTSGKGKKFKTKSDYSLLVLPITIGSKWSGFMGFVDTDSGREWSDNDVRLLRTASEIVGLYIGRKNSEQRVHSYQDQLRHLAYELSIAEERQRKQLATQLHDTIVQNLAISKINMGMMKNELHNDEISGKIDKIVSLIDLSIKQSRNLMNELSPPMLFDLGFAEAIEGLIDDLEVKFGLKAEITRGYKALRLPQDKAIVLYTSMRELMMNVIKHSGSKEAKISLNIAKENLYIEIADNGKGFDPDTVLAAPGVDKGFGLFSVRERLSYIDGELTIDSVPGKGTTVTLRIPFSKKEAAGTGGLE